MSSKVFIGGLPFSTNEDELRHLFTQYGPVRDVKIVTDHETGRSKGFGFITFEDGASAQDAILQADGMEIRERRVSVREAVDRRNENRDNFRSPQKRNYDNRSW